jgi:RNA polymerase sigma factor (sigma-70 family)
MLVDVNTTESGAQVSAEELRDRSLIEDIARGNRQAFELLYREYYPRVSRFLLKLVNRPELIGELYNDVMYTVWKKAGDYQGRSKVSTWIFGIAHFKGIKAGQRQRSRDVEYVPLDDDREADTSPEFEIEFDRAVLQRSLRAELEKLPPEQRMVIELTYYNDFSYTEIGEIVNAPVNTVKTRMFHARRKLRKLLIKLEQTMS